MKPLLVALVGQGCALELVVLKDDVPLFVRGLRSFARLQAEACFSVRVGRMRPVDRAELVQPGDYCLSSEGDVSEVDYSALRRFAELGLKLGEGSVVEGWSPLRSRVLN